MDENYARFRVHEMNEADSVEILTWLRDHRVQGNPIVEMESAARHGNFEKLLFLQQAGIGYFTREAASAAAKCDLFDIFQWIRANYTDPTTFSDISDTYKKQWSKWAMFMQFESAWESVGLA